MTQINFAMGGPPPPEAQMKPATVRGASDKWRAPLPTVPELRISVRALNGAVIYSDEGVAIPEDNFVAVEVTPTIAIALDAGDLETNGYIEGEEAPKTTRRAGLAATTSYGQQYRMQGHVRTTTREPINPVQDYPLRRASRSYGGFSS